jgi:maleylacetate reductase
MKAPLTLAQLGMAEADLDLAADLATQNAYWNPAPLDREGLRRLLDAAFNGRPPEL